MYIHCNCIVLKTLRDDNIAIMAQFIVFDEARAEFRGGGRPPDLKRNVFLH
jgi:hypothetical protein